MRIFLTGGTGFVGLALTARLLAKGHRVDVMASEPAPDMMNAALPVGAKFYIGDVRDRQCVEHLVSTTRPDLVIHAAAATPDAAHEAAGNAAECIAINVGGTATIIETAAACGLERVMILSSVAVYGRTLAEAAFLDEQMVPKPQTLYGISKFAAECIALRLGAVHGIKVLAPRLGVLWGPWEHRTNLRTTLSPVFHMVELARNGQDIWLPFEATAPLCPIADACEMLMSLIAADWDIDVVNVGANQTIALLAMAEQIAKHYGVKAGLDEINANVPLFAVNRPPMDLTRFRALTGRDFTTTDASVALAQYIQSLNSLERI